MSHRKLSLTEILFLVLAACILTTGFVLFYAKRPGFEWYIKEDQLVEWLTVIGLLLASSVCFVRFFRLLRNKSWWFLTVTFLLGLMLFVAAGEEISWGQRILGIKSSEYFQKYNAQGETNLHNLVVGGVKINKLIFSTLLSIGLAVYLVLIPILHRRKIRIRRFLDRSGVPVPQLYQTFAIVIIFVITSLLRHEKSPELLECAASLVFFLIIAYPFNAGIFRKTHSTFTR